VSSHWDAVEYHRQKVVAAFADRPSSDWFVTVCILSLS
jgi:hypothetical protein